jgi:hypothetical protein
VTSPAPDDAQPAVVSAPVVVAPADPTPAPAEAPAAPAVDPRVTKRRVTMRSAVMGSDGAVHTHEAVDFVRPDFLDAYLADVRGSWQFVEVSDEPDAGPAGFDGPTFVPAGLDTPLANTYFPATGADGSDAPAGATVVTEA